MRSAETTKRNLDVEFLARLAEDGRARALYGLVAEFSLWVSPAIVRVVGGAVYPKTRRKRSGEQRNTLTTDGTRLWENHAAKAAFWIGRGEPVDFDIPRRIRGATVCHIYGDEESAYLNEHFSHLANLVALPSAIAGLSDSPGVRPILKRASFEAYGYTGPRGIEPPIPEGYPKHWPDLERDCLPENVERIARRLIELRDQVPTFYEPKRKVTSR